MTAFPGSLFRLCRRNCSDDLRFSVRSTAQTHTTGGCDGASRTSDGRLDVKLSTPGTAGGGTNPEQLFAARAVDVEVDLGVTDGVFLLRARLNVSLPGLDRAVAQAVVDGAHQACPYSKATRGNIDVAINLI
jgi:organic hydroperoxide reductase OsmC/OhrA